MDGTPPKPCSATVSVPSMAELCADLRVCPVAVMFITESGSGESDDGDTDHAGARNLRIASEGVRAVNVFTAREATVLDLVKHTTLVVSLDSLAELNGRLSDDRHVGHVNNLEEFVGTVSGQHEASA
jgi:hypothetical protein